MLDGIGLYWTNPRKKGGHRKLTENRLTNSSSTSVSDQYLPEKLYGDVCISGQGLNLLPTEEESPKSLTDETWLIVHGS